MNMTARPVDDFSDLDDFDTAQVRNAPAKPAAALVSCPRCRGTGDYHGPRVHQQASECFTCKGTGKVRADWQKRRAAFQKGVATKAANLAAKRNEWREANPAEAAWLTAKAGGNFDFANSLSDALDTYGSLTPNQLAAVQRCMAKDAERAKARAAEAKANETQLDAGVSKILDALNQAAAKGLKAPKIRTEHLNFALAKPSSRNPGCVYVTEAGEAYIGKITQAGVFAPTRDCTPEQKQLVVNIAADPLQAAVAFGRMTGRCSCCGCELTDPESVRLGIGPICMARYF